MYIGEKLIRERYDRGSRQVLQVPATWRHRDISAGKRRTEVVPPKHLQPWRSGHHSKGPEGLFKFLKEPSMWPVSG